MKQEFDRNRGCSIIKVRKTKEQYALSMVKLYLEDKKRKCEKVEPKLLLGLITQFEFDYEAEQRADTDTKRLKKYETVVDVSSGFKEIKELNKQALRILRER